MKQDRFEALFQKEWRLFQQSIAAKKKQRRQFGFPELYRRICHQLAIAKTRRYNLYLVHKLNDLVLSGHQRLYQTKARFWQILLNYILNDFPRVIRKNWLWVLTSSCLFYLPLFIITIILQYFPELVYSLFDEGMVIEFEEMYDPANKQLGHNYRGSDSDFLMFAYYIYNNISVAFQCFASGILFMLGSIFYLVFNGIMIGGIMGHLIQVEYTEPFFSFVSGHSAMELTAIVFSGAAGLKMGAALIWPGHLSRLDALKNSAINAMPIIYGTIGMLVIAAFIEGYWSSTASIEPMIKYIVGGLLWFIVIIYFAFVGRNGSQ